MTWNLYPFLNLLIKKATVEFKKAMYNLISFTKRGNTDVKEFSLRYS